MKHFYKTNKIILILFFVAAICIGSLSPFYSYAEESSPQELVVGVPKDRCPVFYVDSDTGEIVGIGVDLMRSAAEKSGYRVTFKEIEEESLKDALDNPAYDVLMPFGSAITSTAGTPSVVSENLIQTPFTLVTEGKRAIPPMDELKIGMLSSLSGGADTVRQLYPGVQIVFYDTMDDAVKALRSDKVDALLHNSYVWSYVLQKPSYRDLEVQPSAMFSMDFRVGTPDTPAGREIIEKLNVGIAELTETYKQAVVLDYTTRRLYRYGFSDYLYQYGLFVLFGVLLFTALVLITIFKREAFRLQQEEKMRWLEEHDGLTGVLSLDGFRKRVEELLRQNPDTPYLLVFANIRNFKYINDSFGMKTGDELLRYWFDRTEESLSDKEAVCRLGGDHMAVLRHSGGDERLKWDDEEIIDSVRNYFLDRDKENKVQVCGGIYVLTPEDYRVIDVDHMIDFARVAEKKVRETRKDGYEFYNPDQWEKGKRIADVVGYLPVAIETGEIQVWYQPQVNYKKKEISGYEALCRWNHAKYGWIPPSEFIPELEESGLIFDLDTFVWDKVCQDLKRWEEQGEHRSVSVNLSRNDIREDRDIAAHFRDLIVKYGLTVDQLRIEITETAFAENPELLLSTTEKLRDFGFKVEMDDFGSGYSSLHMLKEVSVDRIKLDMNFLTGTGDAEKGNTIVGYMIQMINSLGMEMIVEGVETASQADFLLEKGCSEMQGFYFYKPMPM